MNNEIKEIIDIWHPVSEEWSHIYQVVKENEIEYYTNGKLITIKKTYKNNTLKFL